MTKKTVVFALSVLVIGCFVLFANNGSKPSQDSTLPVHNDSEAASSAPSFEAINATYGDYSASLEEMRKNADVILIGKPVSVFEQREYGVISNVEVKETLKGQSFEKIRLYQIGRVDEEVKSVGDVLEFGQTYVLFLGKQEDGEPDTYYVKAGWQGAFLQHADGSLSNKDSTMSEELTALQRANSGKKAKDALIDFVSEGQP